jgi:hypothetical protein
VSPLREVYVSNFCKYSISPSIRLTGTNSIKQIPYLEDNFLLLLTKNFPAFHETRNFTAVFEKKRNSYWSLSWQSQVSPKPNNILKTGFNIIPTFTMVFCPTGTIYKQILSSPCFSNDLPSTFSLTWPNKQQRMSPLTCLLLRQWSKNIP